MRGKLAVVAALVVAAGLSLTGRVSAQPAPIWVPLGCQDVAFHIDHDVIRVGARDGRFTHIRLRVTGNDVNLLSLKVIYENGEPDTIPVRGVIPSGGVTPQLDLRGRDRGIRRIELLYVARPEFRGRTKVCAEGRVALAPLAPPPVWVALGCRDVSFSVDRDVIRVGVRDGRFTHIRLRVTGNDVRMLDLKVIYTGGEPDDLPVRAVIRAGGQSGQLDLRGRDRSIDRVEMIYAARPNFRGRARVCVDGRRAL